ncbi:MAG: hypothetical protein FWD82_02420 [Defluviitaleaceae bacterium]|nr:hypothetical protein [Defluviitaleaceae bacterium]
MQKKQLIIQKIAIIGSFVLSIIMIFYALGYSTNLYHLVFHVDPMSTMLYVPGAGIYNIVQPFNRLLFRHTLFLFLVCLTLFVTLTHKRRLYYVSNYITSLGFAGYSVYIALMIMHYNTMYRNLYLQVDFARLREITDRFNLRYVESTLMLDMGFVLAFILIGFAALLVLNLVLKTIWTRREKWLDEEAK